VVHRGHGVILDSVNHFSSQGFSSASGLKTPEDRMAFAVDHLSVSYSELRDFAARKVFDNAAKATKEVTDGAAFRFISNFVRNKRKFDL